MSVRTSTLTLNYEYEMQFFHEQITNGFLDISGYYTTQKKQLPYPGFRMMIVPHEHYLFVSSLYALFACLYRDNNPATTLAICIDIDDDSSALTSYDMTTPVFGYQIPLQKKLATTIHDMFGIPFDNKKFKSHKSFHILLACMRIMRMGFSILPIFIGKSMSQEVLSKIYTMLLLHDEVAIVNMTNIRCDLKKNTNMAYWYKKNVLAKLASPLFDGSGIYDTRFLGAMHTLAYDNNKEIFNYFNQDNEGIRSAKEYKTVYAVLGR